MKISKPRSQRYTTKEPALHFSTFPANEDIENFQMSFYIEYEWLPLNTSHQCSGFVENTWDREFCKIDLNFHKTSRNWAFRLAFNIFQSDANSEFWDAQGNQLVLFGQLCPFRHRCLHFVSPDFFNRYPKLYIAWSSTQLMVFWHELEILFSEASDVSDSVSVW